MGKYLIHGSYTQSGIKGVIQDGGTGRVNAVKSLAASVGGSVESFYFAFGEDDFFVTVDLPDHTAAAAVAATVGASGAVSVNTTVLLSPEEMDKAVSMHPDYRPPGS